MAKGTIEICDICGLTHNHLSGEKYQWWDAIDKVVISFKQHSGVQSEPLKDSDLCTKCAKEIEKTIVDKVTEMKSRVIS